MVGGDLLILLLYVYDLFITGGEHLIEACKKDLASEFEMTDLGSMHYFLAWRCGKRMDMFSWGKENMLQIF